MKSIKPSSTNAAHQANPKPQQQRPISADALRRVTGGGNTTPPGQHKKGGGGAHLD